MLFTSHRNTSKQGYFLDIGNSYALVFELFGRSSFDLIEKRLVVFVA